MARKALLIGAQTGELRGVLHDVASMSEALHQRGFAVDTRVAADATRTGILDGYERMIAGAEPNDAIVVFYSGHGGYSAAPGAPPGSPGRRAMQFIVPADFHESTEDDFRGISSVELSVLQARLTAATANVVVALDCCHAAHLSRDAHLTVKALEHPYDVVLAHVNRMRAAGLRDDTLRSNGDPDAIRLVACAPDQSAFEYTNQGIRTGLFTEGLTLALTEAGNLPVTWATVLDRVRRHVLAAAPSQRPELEGPSRRLLFELTEVDPISTLPALAAPPGRTDRVRLDGARLLGVGVGDEFVVMPVDALVPDDATKVGDAVVDTIGPLAAWARLWLRGAVTAVPIGARAHRTRAVAPGLPVRMTGLGPHPAVLLDAFAASSRLRLARADEWWVAEVRVNADGGLTVADQVGPLHDPRRPDLTGARQVVADLERLARAHALRTLTEDPQWTLTAGVAIEWGRVVAGTRRPLEHAGAVLRVGEAVYVSVRNDSRSPIWVNLLDIGVAGQIGVVTPDLRSGQRLDPGQVYVLGWDDLLGRLDGETLAWPDGLDPDRARPETMMVIVTSAAQDLSVLEQAGVRPAQNRGRENSRLEDLVDQLATGRTRDIAGPTGPGVRYAVHAIHFELSPSARSTEGGAGPTFLA